MPKASESTGRGNVKSCSPRPENIPEEVEAPAVQCEGKSSCLRLGQNLPIARKRLGAMRLARTLQPVFMQEVPCCPASSWLALKPLDTVPGQRQCSISQAKAVGVGKTFGSRSSSGVKQQSSTDFTLCTSQGCWEGRLYSALHSGFLVQDWGS